MRDPSHQATSARMNGYGTMVLVRYLAGASPELEVYDGIRNRVVAVAYSLNPNPPKDTDGRREESGRGVRELQGK